MTEKQKPTLTLLPGDKLADEAAIDRMFRALTGRDPTPEEKAEGRRRIEELKKQGQ